MPAMMPKHPTRPATLLVGILAALSASAGPLHEAAEAGDNATVARLLAQGADVEARDEAALTPLVTAALAGHADTVEVLIAGGADPRGRDGKGYTALHAAAYAGHPDVVTLLIQHGVDVNDQDNRTKLSPLHAAAEANAPGIVKALLAAGASADVEEANGWTPVMRATFKENAAIVQLLREHGATCSARAGKTFLRYCMEAGG